MNDIIQPESFSEFFGIWLFYTLSFGLIVHLLMYALGSSLIAVALATKQRKGILGQHIARFGVFMAILLFVSGAFNALWSCSIWGYCYETFGADTENDFTPFFPVTQTEINAEHGKLLSGNIHQLQLMWLLFASLAWATSFLLYRLIRPHLNELILRQAQDDGSLEPKDSVNSVCLP